MSNCSLYVFPRAQFKTAQNSTARPLVAIKSVISHPFALLTQDTKSRSSKELPSTDLCVLGGFVRDNQSSVLV